MKRYTDWFENVQPEREGVYQRDYGGSGAIYYAKYVDGRWMKPRSSIALANVETFIAFVQNLPWRGLAEKPE